jgi:hypothetical protein
LFAAGFRRPTASTCPKANVAVLDFGLVYTSVAARNPCNFAVVSGTDAQVLKELTTQRATELNSKVDIAGETPEDVAKELLVQAKIIDGRPPPWHLSSGAGPTRRGKACGWPRPRSAPTR